MNVCKLCGHECDTTEKDFGIGGYEYWGATGNDVDIVEVSDCCWEEFYAAEGEEE